MQAHRSRLLIGLLVLAHTLASAADDSESQHRIDAVIAIDAAAAGTSYAPWTEAGAGKLRYVDGTSAGGRLLLQYRGRLTPTIALAAALDGDGTDGNSLGLTELAVEWRPVPSGRSRHRMRAGAIYPPFSVENGGPAWSNPFGLSFSAVNAWLAEEIRPIGLEWQTTRRIGDIGSRHELGGFAALFYGNDPAGTLLFWRGFAPHDRQTRLHERLPLPSIPISDDSGNVTALVESRLDPIAETDGEPGFYAGIEWRMRNTALVQLARYDNRADPTSFRNGQWGWDTRFWHAAGQVSLPARFGLMAQWMDGDTDWLTFTTVAGDTTTLTEWVRDGFDARFVTLTRPVGERHRLSLRHDRFGMHRKNEVTSDDGDAWTISYQFESAYRFAVSAEALRIESRRELWPFVFGLSAQTVDRQFRLRIRMDFARQQ